MSDFTNSPPESKDLSAQAFSNDPPVSKDLSSEAFTGDPPGAKDLSAAAFSNVAPVPNLFLFPEIVISGAGESGVNGVYALKKTAGVPDISLDKPIWEKGTYTLEGKSGGGWKIMESGTTTEYSTESEDPFDASSWTEVVGTSPEPSSVAAYAFTKTAPQSMTL